MENYRGITLSATIGKWWTVVLHGLMQELADERDWMGRTQSGFTPGCQTGENVLVLRTLLHRAKKKNEPLKAAFIDLKKVVSFSSLSTFTKKFN